MKTGRPPKPTLLHRLEGTLRASTRQSRPHEPQPDGDLREAPSWFNDDQRASWEYAIAHSPAGLLKLIDRGMLVLWVEAESRHRIATITQNELNKRTRAPYLVKGPDGMMVSPYVEIIDRASKIMFRAADAMGFSPVARPRIRMAHAKQPDESEQNPWADLRVIDGGKATG